MHDLTLDPGSATPVLVQTIDDEAAFRTPHRHAFAQLLVIEAGSGVHDIDFAPVPVRVGELHLLAPGQVHSWHTDPGLRCTAVMFAPDALDPIGGVPERVRELVLFGAAPIVPAPAAAARQRRLLDAIADAGSPAVTTHLLAALLLECGDAADARAGSVAHSPLTRSFIRDVMRHADARLTVTRCAARLGVTAGHLAEQVMADTGSTPSRIIRAAVTREARRLLSGTDLSAAQISRCLGFSEASYFSRFFRRETGCTPTEYRELGARGDHGTPAERHAG
ncbi:helix-turn-helix domain-containing protein [Agromyces larvae]|uniref:AraC family transcriptional regulator n=1 Tax=Agromyces larvae TaxID=2929802 RepID=A0ABY4C2J9_9MICO|nr:AraC family transcriptional regulator [Agromyces larvae]UOE44386.1 AraC family transcriptional regulator [Agromyces larvae]